MKNSKTSAIALAMNTHCVNRRTFSSETFFLFFLPICWTITITGTIMTTYDRQAWCVNKYVTRCKRNCPPVSLFKALWNAGFTSLVTQRNLQKIFRLRPQIVSLTRRAFIALQALFAAAIRNYSILSFLPLLQQVSLFTFTRVMKVLKVSSNLLRLH